MSQNSPSISNTTIIWICYGLYGAAIICGGMTAVVAVIINYLTRNTADELCKKHIQWQIGTFWGALISSILLIGVSFILGITVVLSFLIYPLWFIFAIWYIYRVAKGALAFNSRKAV